MVKINIIITAKDGIQAREIAEAKYKEFYYITSKKVSKNLYQVTMASRMRRIPPGIVLPEETYISTFDISRLRLNEMFENIIKLVKNVIKEPTEEEKIVERILLLYFDIKKVVETQ